METLGHFFMATYDDMETDDFKKEFWKWFDSLSEKERKTFNEYPSDMAPLNFYNRVWRHRK